MFGAYDHVPDAPRGGGRRARRPGGPSASTTSGRSASRSTITSTSTRSSPPASSTARADPQRPRRPPHRLDRPVAPVHGAEWHLRRDRHRGLRLRPRERHGRVDEIITCICPSDPQARARRRSARPSSYAGCHHDVEAPIDVDNHGVFFLNSRVSHDDLTDGSLDHDLRRREAEPGPGRPAAGCRAPGRPSATPARRSTRPDRRAADRRGRLRQLPPRRREFRLRRRLGPVPPRADRPGRLPPPRPPRRRRAGRATTLFRERPLAQPGKTYPAASAAERLDLLAPATARPGRVRPPVMPATRGAARCSRGRRARAPGSASRGRPRPSSPPRAARPRRLRPPDTAARVQAARPGRAARRRGAKIARASDPYAANGPVDRPVRPSRGAGGRP